MTSSLVSSLPPNVGQTVDDHIKRASVLLVRAWLDRPEARHWLAGALQPYIAFLDRFGWSNISRFLVRDVIAGLDPDENCPATFELAAALGKACVVLRKTLPELELTLIDTEWTAYRESLLRALAPLESTLAGDA